MLIPQVDLNRVETMQNDKRSVKKKRKLAKKPVRVAVVVWMKPSLKAKLSAVARKQEKSLSSVIRDSLTEAVR